MIISPPFLPNRAANQTDAAYLDTAMDEQNHGRYPVSNKLAWHGGLHLLAPARGNGREPVRAIADGTIVFVRNPKAKPADPTVADADELGYNGWTDNGCVVIRHDTSIGANDTEETTVRFFSIYMHLSAIRSTTRTGEAIRRKAEIGNAGVFEGSANIIHFEIICDDENLQRLIGRNNGLINTSSNGRTDAVFGEMYFKLLVDTQIYPSRPPLNQIVGNGGVALGEDLFVGMLYGGGNVRVTTYRTDGTTIGAQPILGTGAEYALYADSRAIVNAYRNARAATLPSHSAVYELLRFGRVLGPDQLSPLDTPHWRQINTPAGTGWVNLNAAAVTKFSDADAPHWAGWHLATDTTGDDSRCDWRILLNELDVNQDSVVSEAEATQKLAEDGMRRFLKKVICKFPTEWHRGSLATRWNWLTTEGPNGRPTNPTQRTYLTQATFPEFQRYAEALCFWEEAAVGIPETHWHFNPREFVSLFQSQIWLSRNEFAQIYTNTPENVRDQHRASLNKVARKYFYNTNGTRLAHFLGQGAVESGWLLTMQEASMVGRLEGENFYGTRINPASKTPESDLGHWYGAVAAEEDRWFGTNKYNSRGVLIASSYNWRNGNLGDPHAQQFRGRGFKQLTGLDNYSDYWVYRGWLDPTTFDASWWGDRQYIARNPEGMRLRAPDVPDPHRLVESSYNCMDAGGWFLSGRRSRTLSTIDGDSALAAATGASAELERRTSLAVTLAINGGDIAHDRRLTATRTAKVTLL